MSCRIGVDIGGSFTDFALLDRRSGRMTTHKRLTTPADPSEAVIAGVAELLALAGVAIADVEALVHGTTLVTNAIIERRGVRTAMIVTEGFADVLDIAQERRYDLFDLHLTFPKPVVERRLRLELPERIRHDGTVERAPDLEALAVPLGQAVAEGVEAVAVCLLHAYANPDHEAVVHAWLAERFPALYVSQSAEVLPYFREYERWTTACLNAYVQPVVDRYLARIEQGLAGLGFGGRFYIMGSSGGTLTPAVARAFPVRLLESGPAAGALMSATHGAQLGLGQLLSFDMGGTTAKGCIVRDGAPLKSYAIEVARTHEFKRGSGLPVRIPVIDMIEIGAGGGGLAEVDERGVLRVGPRSAGASPGPACYGRGGTGATLTDANLLLGYLDAGSFLGGRMRLDRDAAVRAVTAHVATPLGVDVDKAAWGIHEVINEDVARAFRVHASERGVDYRNCTMVAFGGSGPVHALRIARKLRIPRVLCPAGAGVMSAFGLLTSPLSFEVARSRRMAVADLAAEGMGSAFADLDRAAQPLREAGVADRDIRINRRLDMRYAGQGYEIEVKLPDDADVAALPALFAHGYASVFGTSFDDRPLEIVTWKAEAMAPAPGGGDWQLVRSQTGAGGPRQRPAWLPETGGFAPVAVHIRAALPPGTEIRGPALIEEPESTCVIGVQDIARIDDRFNLVVELGAE